MNKSKYHCLFEQSGTFKNEFKKLGYDAFDYDIQNEFDETDYIIDIFREIEKAYEKEIYKKMKRFSLIQNEKTCYVCNTTLNIHTHEVFHGKNRKKSIEDGCCVYLCGRHHNQSNAGVHFNKELENILKKQMQLYWMKYYNKNVNDFIKRYGRNYL